MIPRFRGAVILAITVLVATSPIGVTARAETKYATGVLWRVDGTNGARNHVFGTIHLTEERVVRLPKPVLSAFQEARSLTLEILKTPETIRAAQSTMLLRDGRALDEIIGYRLFEKLVYRAREFGIPEKTLRRIKPWAGALMLALPRAERARQAAGAQALDFALLASARLRGLPQFGLESATEQTEVFDGLEEADQISLLRVAIEDHRDPEIMVEQLVELYLARNLAGLSNWWTEEKARLGKRLAELIERRLLIDRNLNMVDRMEARLADGGNFVAVGAMHLPGRNGILALLARRGFRVTPVY